MKEPKDLHRYLTAAAAAKWLRALADDTERFADRHPLVKFDVQLSNWNPEWAKKS